MKGKLRKCLRKISLNLEGENEVGGSAGAENNIRTNCGNRRGIACVFQRLTEGI